ncbi:helix-turn-helix transcriptional regulator [Aquipuribacter nitratireducens]|uniref:AAA family ATPase n=1 Tax=Aquipuribacter nitratireducens TaxID=650104 RepID=A0ABW0GJF7_9MICO
MSRLSLDAPLVGRADELARLLDRFEQAASGRPGAVLLAGDAGAGKTRLVEAVAERVAGVGALVLRGHCVDFGAAGLPYLAFAEALGDHLSATGAVLPEALAPLLGAAAPPATPAPPPLDAVADATAVEVGRLRLFEAVAAHLGGLSRQQPLLLVVEDLHWADPSSRDLLRYLLGRMRRERVLVVTTYRSDDLHRSHPVRGLLGELARLPHVERVEVRPFDRPGMARFLAVLAGRDVPAGTVQRVLDRSEGNAYFAEELFAAGDRPGVPDGLADVLLARLERLSPRGRQVARVASVGGRRVDDTLLAAVSGLPRDELDDALREAVSAQVLRPEGERFAFRHALLQEVVYDDLLPGERRRWHGEYAAALVAALDDATTGGPAAVGGSAAELAHHALAAHDLPTALSACVRAADEAVDRLAPRQALAHLERAIELYDAVPDAAARLGQDDVDLHRRAAGLASRCGQVERAVALARGALDRAHAAGDAHREGTLQHRLAQHLIAAERTEEALEHARAAVALLDVDGTATDAVVREGPPHVVRDRAWALAGLARALMLAGAPQARQAAERALAVAVEAGLTDVEADALATVAVSVADDVAGAGDPEAVERLADERLVQAVQRSRSAGDLLTELRASVNLGWSRHHRGDLEGALAVADDAVERAGAAGLLWSPLAVELRVLRRLARYMTGRWRSRPEADTDLAPDTPSARLAAIDLYVAVGRGDEAADAAVERLVPLRGLDLGVQVVVDGCLAELRRWQGRPEEAADLARAGRDELARAAGEDHLGLVWFGAVEVAALADVAEEALLRRDETRAGALARRAERRAAAVEELVARADADPHPRSRPGLEALAWRARLRAELARLGPDPVPAWREAVTAFTSLGHPFEAARCHLGLAAALLASGGRVSSRDEVEALVAQVRGVATELRATPLLDRADALARRAGLAGGAEPELPHPLTAREREVLGLVAHGLTNRQVGAALFISEKTVSVHLSNLMAKLGAGSRTEAVSLAHRGGLLPVEPHGRQGDGQG